MNTNTSQRVHLIKTLGRVSFFLDEKTSEEIVDLSDKEYLPFLNKVPVISLPLLRHFTLIHVLFSSISSIGKSELFHLK